jgi:hypothetical protein
MCWGHGSSDITPEFKPLYLKKNSNQGPFHFLASLGIRKDFQKKNVHLKSSTQISYWQG